MCKFFSLVSNGDGKPLYFDAKLRKVGNSYVITVPSTIIERFRFPIKYFKL